MDANQLGQQQDELQARAALQKLREGKKVPAGELAALERVQNRRTLDHLKQMTPKFFREITSLQTKQLHDWEDQYGIRCGRGRKTINMLDVLADVRTYIKDVAKGKYRGGGTESDSELKNDKLKNQNEKLKEQVRKLKMENESTARESIPKAELSELHSGLQADLRSLGEQFARTAKLDGMTAQRMLNAALENYRRRLKPMEGDAA